MIHLDLNKWNLLAGNRLDPVWVADGSLRFVFVNPAFCRMIGHLRRRLVQRSLEDILHPASLRLVKNMTSRRGAKPRMTRNVRLWFRHGKGGSICLQCRLIVQPGVDSFRLFGIGSRESARRMHCPADYSCAETCRIREDENAGSAASDNDGRVHAKACHVCYRLIFERSRDAIFIADPDGRFVEANLAACSMTGYSRQELLGLSISDLLCSGGAYSVDLNRVMTGEDAVGEAGLMRKDGTCIDVEFVSRSFVQANKRCVHASVRDISDKKRIGRSLAQIEEKFRKISSSAQDAIILTDNEGKITFWNQAAEKLFGYSSQEALGRDCHTLIAPRRYHEAYQNGFSEFMESGQGFSVGKTLELEAVKKDGTEFPVELSVSAARLKGKWSAIGIICDISERKLAQEALKESENRLADIIDFLPDATFAVDRDGKVLAWNRAIEEMTGVSAKDMLGKSNYEYAVPFYGTRRPVLIDLACQPDQEIEKKYAYVQKKGELLVAEGHVPVKGQRRILWGAARPLHDSKGRISGAIESIRDVTEEKKLQREAEYQRQQLIQANRLASLGEVVAGVAHEINNPNAFISYNIPLLEETWAVFEPIVADYATRYPEVRDNQIGFSELCRDMREIIQAIKVGSERIERVVSNLKNFARPDDVDGFEEVRINEVIQSAMMIVGAQLRKSALDIQVKLADDLPLIQGNFRKLEQVVANLLVNASQAIPNKENGRVVISTRYVQRLQSLVVEIEDNGVGMAPAVIEHIFEPFFTTRRNDGGTGLGLAISYSLVQEHKGRIGVLSHPGIGARFSIFLPEDRKVDLALRPTVLCVDDDESFLRILETYFLSVENRPLEATRNPESVETLLTNWPEVDIVLSDVVMQEMSGWQLLERIKKRFPLVTVILCSGYNIDPPAGFEGQMPDFYLKKPFRMAQLDQMINTVGRIWL